MAGDLLVPETRLLIVSTAPSFQILTQLLADVRHIDHLHWREFEELVAELLQRDGYEVTLGHGRNDGGVDIIAVKDLGPSGLFKSVWQAKKQGPESKVELPVIRELADVRDEQKANKGMIVTTSYLTSGALKRVTRDQYVLGKVDRDDLIRWIESVT